MKNIMKNILIIALLLSVNTSAQISFDKLDPDTVKHGRYDMGKMWTFENFPHQYFNETYEFQPSDEWIDHVMKSAILFSSFCSASFVSQDGLIMTNYHCARDQALRVELENENLLRDGFYAESFSGERKIPGLYVDQVVLAEDITDKVYSGEIEPESSYKLTAIYNKVDSITESYRNEYPDLVFNAVEMYEGGKFSIYGYKRHEDIRLVFLPDMKTAEFGGVYDYWSYPRHSLDCAFLRVYENDKPLETDNFFKWTFGDLKEGEPVFVAGRPGSTNRLITMSQIDFLREHQYADLADVLTDLNNIYENMVEKSGADDFDLLSTYYSVNNSMQVYNGILKAMYDPYLIARKQSFEYAFMDSVYNDPVLREEYGFVWKQMEKITSKMEKISDRYFALNINPYFTSEYFFIAEALFSIAFEGRRNAEVWNQMQDGGKLEETLNSIFPEDLDNDFENEILKVQVNLLTDNLPETDTIVRYMFDGLSGEKGVQYALSKSEITDRERVKELLKMKPDSIILSSDPFIFFIRETRREFYELQEEYKEYVTVEEELNRLLGEALYKVFGDNIPPDATSTLRIADGIIKSYNYNGTLAPVKTTIFGMLNKHFSFGKQFPFKLPDRWEKLPSDFVLSSSLNFISTNDITGGNSGSPVINTEGEVIGVAFDGNYDSFAGEFIYTTELNRTISVSTEGITQILRYVYNAGRIADELMSGGAAD